MAFKRFLKIRLSREEEVGQKHVNAVQDNIETALSQVLSKDILDRRFVTANVVPSGINYVNHGLGRNIIGASLCLPSQQDLRTWLASGTNLSPSRTLPIMASATGTVNLEVF